MSGDDLADKQNRLDMIEIFLAERISNIYDRIGALEEVIEKMSDMEIAELEKLGSEHLKTCMACTKSAVRHYLDMESPVDNIRAQQLLEKSELLVEHSNKVLSEIDKTPQQKARELAPYMVVMYLIVLFAEYLRNWSL